MDPSSSHSRYRPARVNIVFGVFGTLAIATVALLLWWSDTAPARYAVMPCQYNAIFETAGPVGAVILGTSRAQHGVSPRLLSADLAVAGLPDNVISLARGNRGPEQLYQMLLDVDHQRGLQGPIIIEYSPKDGAFFQRSPLYYWYYGGYAANAEFSTFAIDWQAKPREPAYSRLRDLLGHLEYRLDAAIENSTNGKSSRNRVLAGTARDHKPVVWCLGSNLANQNNGQRKQIRRVYDTAVAAYGANPKPSVIPPMRNDMKRINQDAQNHYLDLIISLAQRRGVAVYAITVPGFLEPAPSPATLIEFKERFGIPLLFPDAKALEVYGDPTLFTDAFHLNLAGNKVYTDWLASIIVQTPAS
jgi:hypothetical protein